MPNLKMIHLHREGFDEFIGKYTYEEDGYWGIIFGLFLSHQEMKEFSLCLN